MYQAAGYKPRNNTNKKKKEHDVGRAATDDQLALSTSGTTGPVRGIRRRRAQTSQGILLRGGTKSVPQSAACSEYEDSSGPEDEDGDISSGVTTNIPKTPLSSMPLVSDGMKKCDLGLHPSPSSTIEHSFIDDDDMGMRLIPLDSITSDPLADYPSSALENHPQPPNPISPLQHTLTHPHHTWASLRDNDGNSVNGSHQTSPQHHDGPKIGQSAWGPQDWLSANPRLDHSFPSTNGNSTPGTGTPSSYFSPSSPFTSYNLPPLNNANSHPLSPPSNTTTTSNATTSPTTATASTTTTGGNTAPPPSSSSAAASTPQTPNPLIGNITNLTTLNLPMNYINYYNSHQHHGVIERYDLWPPSSSALALSSTFSAVNNSSGWSGSGGGYSGPFGSESFAGDISSNSEVSFNEDEVQSAFSDEYSNADEVVYNSMGYVNNNPGGSGRAITHHSDYAGDLIFGARGYGIGGGFGWFGGAYAPPNITGPHSANGNPGTPGLGLVGITTKGNEKTGEGDGRHGNMENNDEVVVVGDGKGSINPMQLHAPSPHTQTTTAIDEIALAGINLNDSQDKDEEMQAVGVGVPRGENEGVGIEVVEAVEEDDAMDGITTGPTTRRRRRTIGGISGRGLSLTPPSSSSSLPVKRTTQRSVSGGGGVKSATASPQMQFRSGNLRLPCGQTFNHHAMQQQTHPHNIQQAALSIASNAHSTPSPSSSTSSSTSASLATPPGGTRALSSSPPVAPSTTSTNTTTAVGMMTPYGSRFSLDDLDLIEFAQAQHVLVDINNLTPPATPVMHHAIRGSRKYSIFGGGGGGVGGVGGSGGGGGNGLGLLIQGQSGGAGRSISVPPSEVRNAAVSGNSSSNGNNGDGGNNSLGMSFSGGDTGSDESPGGGVTQRGRSLTASGNAVPSATPGVKRSLSSTVHHSNGQAQQHHGHSLSMSTFPPFPPHSEIWRSKTPIAKTSSVGNLGTMGTGNSAAVSSSNVAGAVATIRTTNANASNTGSGTASSFFSGLFSHPSPSSSSSPSSGVSGNQQPQVNTDVCTNPDLSFLDLHYNLGHAQSQALLQQQQQQPQQGFGAMLVDTPSTTSGALMGSGGGFGSGGGGGGMTQAELEARQALDLAQPFYMHGHGHHPHQQQQHHAFGQGQGHHHSLSQGSGFGFPSTTTATTINRNASTSNGNVGSTNVGNGGGGLKTFMGNVFNTPLNLTRQFSQFSVSATTTGQQQQRPQPNHFQQQQQHTHQHQHHHHQRGQSQQVVVNPKDLVLNAGSDSDGNRNGMLSSSLRLDGSKRKRASWDGGMV